MWYNEYSTEWTEVHVCQFELQQIVLIDTRGENKTSYQISQQKVNPTEL